MALYDVQVQRVELHEVLPKVIKSEDIGGVLCQIPGHEEIDLLYHLASPNSSFEKLIRKHDDGKYRILVRKESMTSHYLRKHGTKYGKKYKPTFVWHGWALFTKNKDVIFFDTKWFQVGDLNIYNLSPHPRDIREEVQRTNWNKVPGGGLPRPYSSKEREQEFEQRVKDKVKNIN